MSVPDALRSLASRVILCDQSPPSRLRASIHSDPYVAKIRAGQHGGKHLVVVPNFAIEGIRKYICPWRSRAPRMNLGWIAHGYKLLRVLHGKRSQHDRIDHSENGRVRSDAESQREQRNCGKDGT